MSLAKQGRRAHSYIDPGLTQAQHDFLTTNNKHCQLNTKQDNLQKKNLLTKKNHMLFFYTFSYPIFGDT